MARPSTPNRTLRRTTAVARPLVADRRRSVSYTVELDVRTAFDFVISAHAHAWPERETELLPEDRRWFSDALARVGDATGDALMFGSPDDHGLVGELCHLLVVHPDVRTAADVVRLVDETPAREILVSLVHEILDEDGLGPTLQQALDGDEGALAAFEEQWAASHPEYPLGNIVRNPERSVDNLRNGLRAWLEAYAEIEDRVGRMLSGDADQRRVDLGTLRPAEAIERTTGGLRWLPEPAIERVLLAPCYFGRPYNWLFGSTDWRLIVYPISDEALDAGDRLAPPHAAVRLYRALGDDTRMKILRMLVDRDLYLTEIAQRLELSKPTTKHHLTQLRSAGLVTVTEEGGLTYYSLRRSRVAEAGPELGRFLGI